jgi:hypothetical protein
MKMGRTGERWKVKAVIKKRTEGTEYRIKGLDYYKKRERVQQKNPKENKRYILTNHPIRKDKKEKKMYI